MYTNFTTGAKRRGWDSNPCAQKDKRFSRPPRYGRFDTSPYQASGFVRTRLLRGLPDADYIQRRRSAPACRHRLRTPYINVRVGGDFPATMRVHTQYPARSQMQAPAARTRIFQSSPSCKDSLQLRNIAGAGFEPALLAYEASEQPDRSLPHD